MRGGADAKPESIYHFISRFVAQEFFVRTRVERRMYLTLLTREIVESDWRCFSYAIMSNHIHLGLVAGHDPLEDWLRNMHTDFANWINDRNERIGGVFVRGPKMIEFWPAGVASLVNYIHNNPVRAGVVRTARDSDWTSHRAYCGLARPQSWLDVGLGLALAGFPDGASLDQWMEVQRTQRRELDAFHVEPVKVGRPRKLVGEQSEEDEDEDETVEHLRLHEEFMSSGEDWYYEEAA